ESLACGKSPAALSEHRVPDSGACAPASGLREANEPGRLAALLPAFNELLQRPVARMKRSGIRGMTQVDRLGFTHRYRLGLYGTAFAVIRRLWSQGSGFSPITAAQSHSHISVKRRVRPVARGLAKAVLHWIEVDVIHMRFEVVVVPDRVFPESALPNERFAFDGTPLRRGTFGQ